MECRDCKFLGEPKVFRPDQYPSVRCALGLYDKYPPMEQWYSYGESQLNRGPVRRIGANCTRGEQVEEK